MKQHKLSDTQTTSVDARRVARVSMIAATYAAATLAAILLMGWMAWGPVQLRVSEALCALALLTPDAALGLALGCALANAANIVVGGVGLLGILDVIFGALASYIAARFAWHFRARPKLALLGPVLANALIVPAYLPLMLQGLGFYTIPFTSISLDGAYLPMYIFGVIATGIGEAIVVYVLGLPLFYALKQTPLARGLEAQSTTEDSSVKQ